jgi:hypothetical protein
VGHIFSLKQLHKDFEYLQFEVREMLVSGDLKVSHSFIQSSKCIERSLRWQNHTIALPLCLLFSPQSPVYHRDATAGSATTVVSPNTRARHLIAPQQQPVCLDLAPWLLDNIPPLEDFGASVGGDVPVEEDGEGFEWEHHPLLCGTFLLSVYSIEALSGCFSQ